MENPGNSKQRARSWTPHLKKQQKQKNGHEMDLEMSPRPLIAHIFEEIYMQIQF